MKQGEKHPTEHVSVNAVVCVGNVLFFMVVQILFFWFIASQQIDHTVSGKTEILGTLRKRLQREGATEAVQALDASVLQPAESVRPAVEQIRKNRQQENLRLTLGWILPPILGCLLVLVLLVGFNRWRAYPFTFAHRFGLAMVCLAYVTEILFFLFVVRPYVFVADSDIVCEATGLGRAMEEG